MTFLEALLHLLYGTAINGFVVRAASRLLARVPMPDRNGGGGGPRPAVALDRFVAAVVIAASLVVLLVTVGGAAGLLGRPGIMLVLAGVLWLGVELLPGRARPRQAGPPAAGPAAAAAPAPAEVLRPFHGGILAAAGALVLLAWAPLLAERVVLPPVAWDALTYHLRFPALWLQTGRLATCAAPVGDASHPYYPLAGEMLLYWGLLSTGSDLWSSLSQVPFALAGAAAVASLAMRSGSGTRAALLAGLCWLGTPGVLRQSVEAMVDVEQAAFFAAMLLFALRWRDAGDSAWLLLSAAALGLLVGTKYSGIVFTAGALPLLAWCARGAARGRGAPRRFRAALVLAGLVVALLGGYAYARNVAAGGNPFLPLRVSVGGVTLLRGGLSPAAYFGGAARRLGAAAFLASGRAVLDAGPALIPLLAALPLGLAAALRRRNGGATAWLAATALLGLLLAWAVLPYREHRYFYPVTAVAWCSAAALAARYAAGPARSRVAGAAALGLLAAEVPITLFYWGKDLVLAGPHVGHVAAAVFVAAACVVLLVARRRSTRAAGPAAPGPHLRARAFVFAAAAAACLVLLAGATSLYQRNKYDLWYRYWSTRYPWGSLHAAREDYRDMAASWRYLAGQPLPRGATVAYSGMNIPYPLAGPSLDRLVLFVPRNGNAASSLYDWGLPPPDPLSGASREGWSRNVERLRVAFLCVYRETPELDPGMEFPVERAWADSDPARFSLVWSSADARIYRVLPSRGRGAA